MKRTLGIITLVLLSAAPAYADDDEDNRSSRNRNGRNCKGSQDCSSFSPSFEDSPVDRSFIFEPTICMPFAECRFEDEGESDDGTA